MKSASIQRRCYWLREGDQGMNLVHYLSGAESHHNGDGPVPASPSQVSFSLGKCLSVKAGSCLVAKGIVCCLQTSVAMYLLWEQLPSSSFGHRA